LFNDQLARMEDAGAVLVQIQMPNTGPISSPFTTVLITEFKADLNTYLAAHAQPGVPATLADLIDFNEANAAEVMPHFGQEWFVRAEATNGLNDPVYLDAVDDVARLAGEQGLLATMEQDSLDAIVAPTTGPAWVTNYQSGDAGSPSSAFLPAAAGYPHLTVPMGTVSGRPVGISFIGRAWDDAAILSLGHAYEQLP
jgi:amidase